MRRHFWKIIVLLLLLPLTLTVAHSVVAIQDDACPQIVEQALTDLGQNCNALDRNSACYGFNKLGATFTQAQPDDYFSKVSDRTPLNIVDTLSSSPLDAVNNTWGVAVMKVQANVPNSLPGQAVTFVLLGDTEVRNDVSPADAFTPADPVDVTTVGNVNIRSAASTKANVVGSVTNGTLLKADGRSPDGEWYRVLFNDAPAWASASLLKAPDAAKSLPTVTDSLRTPMQAFYVTTGVGSSACQKAPDVLVVQGPDTMKVNLTINGADVKIGSTIAIRSGQSSFGDLLNNPELVNIFGSLLNGHNTPSDLICNISQFMVIDGEGGLNEGGLRLPTGFTAFSINCGGADRTSGFITPWGGSRPMTPEELNDLLTLNDLPPDILNYPIHVPTPAEIQAIINALGGGGGVGGGAAVGAAGNASMCAALKPTSPLGTMPAGGVQFYWNAAPGATSYTVRVYDSGNALVGEYPVSAPATSVFGSPQGKDNMSWDVSAYVNGQLACTSGRASVIRDTVYDQEPPPQQYSRTCINTFVGQMCNAPCYLGNTCGIPGKDFWCYCPV